MAGNPALKETHLQLKARMEKAVEDFRVHLAGTRTGRANIHMLDNVRVPAYGTEMPLNQLAQLSAPEPNMIVVQPFDPTVLADIEKALRTAEGGFNPQNDGKLVRVPIPAMTEERRRDVVKQINKTLEDHKTAVRNIRRDGNDAIKKALKEKAVSEDESKAAQEEVQKLTDAEIARLEEMGRVKEKEIMQI